MSLVAKVLVPAVEFEVTEHVDEIRKTKGKSEVNDRAQDIVVLLKTSYIG